MNKKINNSNKIRILLTGANGKLGKLVLKKLIESGFTVSVILRPEQKLGSNFNIFKRQIKVLYCQLSQINSILSISDEFKDITHIVHLAGLVDYQSNYSALYDANVLPTVNLIQAVKLSKNNKVKFIYCSSTSVYRKVKKIPITNSDLPHPISNYGKSKLEAEKKIIESGLDYLILRPPMIYGPDFIEQFSGMFKMIKKGKMFVIGNGENQISLIHQDDASDAFVSAVKCQTKNECLNIAVNHISQIQALKSASEGLQVNIPSRNVFKKLAKLFARLLELKAILTGKKPAIAYDSIDLISTDRWFDCTDSMKVLNWKPKIKPETAIKELAEIYLKNSKN